MPPCSLKWASAWSIEPAITTCAGEHITCHALTVDPRRDGLLPRGLDAPMENHMRKWVPFLSIGGDGVFPPIARTACWTPRTPLDKSSAHPDNATEEPCPRKQKGRLVPEAALHCSFRSVDHSQVCPKRTEDDQEVTHSRRTIAVDVRRAGAATRELTGAVLRIGRRVVVVGIW